MNPLEIEVNCFKSIKSKNVIGNIPLSEWVNKIRAGFKVDKIISARKHPESRRDVMKSLPAISYSIEYKSKREKHKIVKRTGLQVFCVKSECFNISSLDLTKILLIYKSFDGRYYNIVVRVDNIGDNILYSRRYIANDLGVFNILTEIGNGFPQLSVFSYDPSIFVNEHCTPYDCSLLPAPELKVEPKVIYTYFIRNNINNLVKIGRSENPFKRVKEISGQVNFVKLELESYIQGDYEKTLHKYYSKLRKEGEWFDLQSIPRQMEIMILHNLYKNFNLTEKQLLNLITAPIRYDNLCSSNETVLICKIYDSAIKSGRSKKKYNLTQYAYNLFLLNPDIHIYKVHAILSSLNTLYFKDCFTKDDITNIVDKALFKSLGKNKFDYVFTYR